MLANQIGARWMVKAALIAAVTVATPSARSQGTSPVIEMLHGANDARTRVQAARTLVRLRPNGTREALERALRDPSAAVRTAAAQSLSDLGDPAALTALRANANDHDSGVRSVIQRAIVALEQNQRNTSNNASAANGANAQGSATATSNGSDNNIQNARYVVRIGRLANRVDGREAVVEALRNAIEREVSRNPDVAPISARQLPPEIEQRVRSGRLHAFALDGSVSSLRTSVVDTRLSVRAEISLVLMAEPGSSIVGTLSGAATAQDTIPDGAAREPIARRLEARALTGAVHGALGNLRQSLTATAR
jgi:hypothetical protein